MNDDLRQASSLPPANMNPKKFIQSDDFATMEMGDKIDYLSQKSPAFKGLPLAKQREYVMTRTKQPSYKPKDFLSKASNYVLPLAGQYGAEGLTGGAGVLAAPETGGGSLAAALASLTAAGGAGATAGETAADYIDYKRGMGPKPSLKSEAKAAPGRFAYGAAGSLGGNVLPGVIRIPRVKEAIGSTLEAVANTPRLYTKALLEGGTESAEKNATKRAAAIDSAASRGASVVKGEAASAAQTSDQLAARRSAIHQQRLSDTKVKEENLNQRVANKLQQQRETELQKLNDKADESAAAIKDHYKKMGYGDPVERELSDPGAEPDPKNFKNIKDFQDAYNNWSRSANPPKRVSLNPSSLYNRYMSTLRSRPNIPPKELVPKEAELLQDFQSVLHDREAKLSNRDYRRFGKATNELSEHISQVDPKYAQLKARHAENMEALDQFNKSVAAGPKAPEKITLPKPEEPPETPRPDLENAKRLGKEFPSDTKGFKEQIRALFKKEFESPSGASAEKNMGDLRDLEKKTGTRFLDDMTNNVAKDYYSKLLPQGRQPWMRRMAVSLPLSLGAGYAMGNKPSAYMMSMLPLMAMMSPAVTAQLLTRGAAKGPQALAQGLRALQEPDRE